MEDPDLPSLGRVASRFLRERRVRAGNNLEALAAYAIGAERASTNEYLSLSEAGFYDIGSPMSVADNLHGLYVSTRPTPLVATRLPGCDARVWVKLEWFNPFSLSMKDRTVYELLSRVREGPLWEASSGNTGIALAALAAARGLKARVYLPRHATRTAKLLIRLFGGEAIETPAPSTVDIAGGGGVRLGQFTSPWNPIAHMRWTGREIIAQLEHVGVEPEALIVPSGTGGTIAGTGFMLQNYYQYVRVVRVIPAPGEIIEGTRRSDARWIKDLGVKADALETTREEALRGMLLLARHSGLAPGVSGGAAIAAALDYCKSSGGDIVVIIPDHALKYPEAIEEALRLEEGL